MILDVLIIGAGPHALTLASLLLSPPPEPDPATDPAEGSSPLPGRRDSLPPGSRTNQDGSRNRRARGNPRKRATANQVVVERPVPLDASGRVSTPLPNLRVVDSYGEWTSLWESQFTALNIPHLRSHTLVHTDPFYKTALQDFTIKQGRTAELQSLPDEVYILDDNAFFNDTRLGKKEKRRLNMASSLKKNLSFSLPGTKLSVDFFKEQVERYGLDKVLVTGTVDSINPVVGKEEEREEEEFETEQGWTRQKREGPRKRVKHFQVLLRGGVTLEARQVVLATGPTRAQMANIPAWVGRIGENFPEERLQHTVHLMHHLAGVRQHAKERDAGGEEAPLNTPGWNPGWSPGQRRLCDAGQRVMVVGGGLTSAHIVSIALQQGASHVTWVMRKHLQLKQFDIGDVEGLVGRYAHVEHGVKLDGRAHLQQFYSQRSLHRRLAMIRQARKGGAVSPEAYLQLQAFIRSGQVEVKTYSQVSEAKWCYRRQVWNLALSTGDSWTGDRIWLATGCKLDVGQDPLLSGVMKEYPIQVIEGWPCITESLQWAPGCPLYVMGQYSALQVGPHAVNLAGGQAASMRIAKGITWQRWQQFPGDALHTTVEQSDKQAQTPVHPLHTYVQQMHGLLWL